MKNKIKLPKIDLKLPDKVFGLEIALVKMFLGPFMVVLLFVISLNVIIVPKVSQIFETLEKINSVNDARKLTNQKRAYLSSLDQEKLQQDADYLDMAVLKEKKSYLLVGVIRKIADKYGFQVKSFSVSPGELKNGEQESLKVSEVDIAMKLPISVVLIGPQESSLALIKGIENSLPILFIDKFSTKVAGGISELDLMISSYYVPEKEDLINGNLTLNDLKLTPQESDLVAKISQFDKIGGFESIIDGENKSFVIQERQNPFSL